MGGSGDSAFLLSSQVVLILPVGGPHLSSKKLGDCHGCHMGDGVKGGKNGGWRTSLLLKIKIELVTTKTVWLEGEKQLADLPSDGVLCETLLKLHEFRFRLSSAFELCPTGWNGYNFPTPEKHTPLFLS